MTVSKGANDGQTMVSRRGDGGRQGRTWWWVREETIDFDRRGGSFNRKGASIIEEEGDRLHDSITEEEGDGAIEQKRREMAGQKRIDCRGGSFDHRRGGRQTKWLSCIRRGRWRDRAEEEGNGGAEEDQS
ncbi:hypothetical protein ACLOJK_005864 [Asimina triloba]